jgi:hypothetical protein
MIGITMSGSFDRTEKFLRFIQRGQLYRDLDGYAREGVQALSAATPVESGLTAASWTYRLEIGGAGAKITWLNSNVNKGVPIAIILQYGHGTGTGGYVQGRDYINPAMRPVFDQIADKVWKAVTSA